MFKRLLLGLLKGLAIGGALGAAIFFGLSNQGAVPSPYTYLVYGLVGALAGVLAGRPPWSKGAWVESLLKGLFGVAVGCGLLAVASSVFKDVYVQILTTQPIKLVEHVLLMSPGIAALFAGLVELDNTGEAEPEPKSGVRIRSIDDIKVDEEDEDDAASARGGAKARR